MKIGLSTYQNQFLMQVFCDVDKVCVMQMCLIGKDERVVRDFIFGNIV